jgi:hypothetical protein
LRHDGKFSKINEKLIFLATLANIVDTKEASVMSYKHFLIFLLLVVNLEAMLPESSGDEFPFSTAVGDVTPDIEEHCRGMLAVASNSEVNEAEIKKRKSIVSNFLRFASRNPMLLQTGTYSEVILEGYIFINHMIHTDAVLQEVSKLTWLKKLCIIGKDLEKLFRKSFFESFPDLEKLDLGDNKIGKWRFPGRFASLKKLCMRNNKLKNVPEFHGAFSKLCKIDLSNNQLKTLPDSFVELANGLLILDLSNNKFVELPGWFKYFTNLRELRLRGNQLKTIPEFFKKFKKLETLDISDNQLTQMYLLIGKLPRLRNFYEESDSSCLRCLLS